MLKFRRLSTLASEEGIFCEPASAASVAGLLKVKDPNRCHGGLCAYCNGLKDPDTAITHNQSFFKQGVEPAIAAVAEAMGL